MKSKNVDNEKPKTNSEYEKLTQALVDRDLGRYLDALDNIFAETFDTKNK